MRCIVFLAFLLKSLDELIVLLSEDDILSKAQYSSEISVILKTLANINK